MDGTSRFVCVCVFGGSSLQPALIISFTLDPELLWGDASGNETGIGGRKWTSKIRKTNQHQPVTHTGVIRSLGLVQAWLCCHSCPVCETAPVRPRGTSLSAAFMSVTCDESHSSSPLCDLADGEDGYFSYVFILRRPGLRVNVSHPEAAVGRQTDLRSRTVSE